jgi:hypothetical protein
VAIIAALHNSLGGTAMINFRILAALVAGLFIFAACSGDIEVTREVEVTQ